MKLVFSTSLLIVFLVFFGLPSLNKYLAEEVMVSKRKMSNMETSTPAITICALNPINAVGWKRSGETTNYDEININNDTDYNYMYYDNNYTYDTAYDDTSVTD